MTHPSTPSTGTVPRLPAGIKGHRATGVAPWPLVLLEGESGSGRSTLAALLTGDKRVGQSYYLDLGEGTGDQYGAVPGAGEYIVLDHDGRWSTIQAISEVLRDEAQRVIAAGEPPMVLIVDSGSDIWNGLSVWAEHRARTSVSNRKLLEADPNARIDVAGNYWNDARSRWNRLINIWKTMPAIVVLICDGEEVAEFKQGKPTANRVWSITAGRNIDRGAMIHIRTRNGEQPEIVKCRTAAGARANLRPGVDRARRVDYREDLLAWTVFEILGAGEGSGARTITSVVVDGVTDEETAADPDVSRSASALGDETVVAEIQQDIAHATDKAGLTAAWERMAHERDVTKRITPAGFGKLRTACAERGEALDRETARPSAASAA